MTAPHTAIGDLRAMVERVIDFTAERGDAWGHAGTPERLLLDAAKLMNGIATSMERENVDFELVERRTT